MGRELIRSFKGSWALPATVLALALGVLGATVYWGADYLRRHFRDHLVSHDGEVLYAVAQARQLENGPAGSLAHQLQSPADQLALTLEISQLKEGVLAVRLFDATGRFVTAFPPSVEETHLEPDVVADLRRLQPYSRYLGTARLTDVFLLDVSQWGATNDIPLLEVSIPLHARGEQTLLGAAQLILDGTQVDAELNRLEEHLQRHALAAFVGGGLLLSGALVWAYRRLRRAHALLQERSARLLQANHELALAAKLNAVGAVSAHLIHGLSNPLASLQDFVAARSNGIADGDWDDALAATRRMQDLVHEIVRVLSEEKGADGYEITLEELGTILETKMATAARERQITLDVRTIAREQLPNRNANLVLLILENLVHNALQVTPLNGSVRIRIADQDRDVVCDVTDQGPGVPPEIVDRLFQPCRSTKGGSGLGLAISQQIANQLGAKLELLATSSQGSTFRLRLPPAARTEGPRPSPNVPSPAAPADLRTT